MNNWLVSQEGILLRQQAEIVFGKPILYSYECESLSHQIKITTGLDISAQTLRRMWGFIKDGVAISKRSEQIVLKYVGIDEVKTLLRNGLSIMDDHSEIILLLRPTFSG